ncbi:MAG: hypothetical protein IJO19_00825 [Clostridia bacterium]|nr:hypothetical protein [Clostridia bacterium]
MTVKELLELDEFEAVNIDDDSRIIKGGYCGDLLSWVMGRAEEDNVFVTIMVNVNVIAVASLINVSCVVICENAELSDELINAAKQKEINLIKTPLASFEACACLSNLINA